MEFKLQTIQLQFVKNALLATAQVQAKTAVSNVCSPAIPVQLNLVQIIALLVLHLSFLRKLMLTELANKSWLLVVNKLMQEIPQNARNARLDLILNQLMTQQNVFGSVQIIVLPVQMLLFAVDAIQDSTELTMVLAPNAKQEVALSVQQMELTVKYVLEDFT